MSFESPANIRNCAAVRAAIAADADRPPPRQVRAPSVSWSAPPREAADGALVVYDPTWGAGRVTGLTGELRPIVTWDSGEVRSRSWDGLTFGEGRAW